MKENIKIGLLSLIALTLVIDTFFLGDNSSTSTITETPQSNIVANPATNNTVNPMTTPNTPTMAPTQQPTPPVLASEKRAKTTMKFTETSHNFGKIKQDTKNTKIFRFINTGSEPLIIEDAKGSCGCTIPKYPKEPIAPGASGEIEVVYSPGKQQGAQNKNVTITANTDPISTVLNISAEVQVVPEE